MENEKVFKSYSADQAWAKITEDFEANSEILEYAVRIDEAGCSITISIDIDLGGGFEGGYAVTRFVSDLKSFDEFRFSLHHQGFIDEIGVMFGMQDLIIGDPEFDKNVVVKSNNEHRINDLLADPSVRDVLASLTGFKFHIGHHHSDHTEVESAYLELRIDDGITDIQNLRILYDVFFEIKNKVDLS